MSNMSWLKTKNSKWLHLHWSSPNLKNIKLSNINNPTMKYIETFQIVETEAYPAGCPRVPKASHGPGSTFIYSIYGVSIDMKISLSFPFLLSKLPLPHNPFRQGKQVFEHHKWRNWSLCSVKSCNASGRGWGDCQSSSSSSSSSSLSTSLNQSFQRQCVSFEGDHGWKNGSFVKGLATFAGYNSWILHRWYWGQKWLQMTL